MQINVTNQTDFYKVGHPDMFPDDTVLMYNNLTGRKSRIPGVNFYVVFMIQYWLLEYVIHQWNRNFFHIEMRERVKDPTNAEWIACKEKTINKYRRIMDNTMGKDVVNYKHLSKLWDLGYMPLKVKALPEGTLCPIGVPCMTYRSTHPDGFFLPSYLETILSCSTWQGMTSATLGLVFRRMLDYWAIKTAGSSDFCQWQGHDFSMRGMSSLESACISGAGHLLSFTGTDTIPAIEFLEQYYGADVEKELVGASVPASEHAVMCMGMKDDELGTVRRLLNKFTNSPVLSLVMDTWDITKVSKPASDGTLYQLKEEILARMGKLVIRPDSCPDGLTPADIICGHGRDVLSDREKEAYYPEFYKKGLVECLAEIFGTTEVTGSDGKTYKVLNSHIGCIYGDSINLQIGEDICRRLAEKGYASTNVVFGIGSFTYQFNTRDTQGFAVKATYGEIEHPIMNGGKNEVQTPSGYIFVPVSTDMNACGPVAIEGREIFKDPISDNGTKKSAKGLISLQRGATGNIILCDQQTWEQEETGLLETVFLDGKMTRLHTLAEIRERLAKEVF